MPLITLGTSSSLVIKIPSRGDTQWASDFQTEFAAPIANHDHTGNGKGAKITTAALEDNAVTSSKLAAQSIIANYHLNSTTNFWDYPGMPQPENYEGGSYLALNGTAEWRPIIELGSSMAIVTDPQVNSLADLSEDKYPILKIDGSVQFNVPLFNRIIILDSAASISSVTFNDTVTNCVILEQAYYKEGTDTTGNANIRFFKDIYHTSVFAGSTVQFYAPNVTSPLQDNEDSLDVMHCNINCKNRILFTTSDDGFIKVVRSNMSAYKIEAERTGDNSTNNVRMDAGQFDCRKFVGEGWAGENGFKLNVSAYDPGAAAGFSEDLSLTPYVPSFPELGACEEYPVELSMSVFSGIAAASILPTNNIIRVGLNKVSATSYAMPVQNNNILGSSGYEGAYFNIYHLFNKIKVSEPGLTPVLTGQITTPTVTIYLNDNPTASVVMHADASGQIGGTLVTGVNNNAGLDVYSSDPITNVYITVPIPRVF